MGRVKQSFVMFSLAIAVLASLPGNASALGLDYYGVEMTLNDNNVVNNAVVMNFDSPVNRLDYNLDFKIENLTYDYDFDFAECSSEDTSTGSMISCMFIGMNDENNKLTLNFDSSNVIKKEGDNFRFTVNYGVPLPIKNSFVLIRLPQNDILAGTGNESYFPTTGQTMTDGRHIMVFWEGEELNDGDGLQFSILYTKPSPGMLGEGLVYLLVVVAVVAVVVAIFYYRRGKGSSVALVKSVLNKDEKRIIDILNEKGGKTGQKVLVRETDFSKAKMSRIIKSLRERGILDIEPISGRENRVILKVGTREEKEKTDF